jgi:hypothetical protein
MTDRKGSPSRDRRESHAREQARANATAAVEMAEDDAQVAASLAIAYALLDIADAIRERSKP